MFRQSYIFSSFLVPVGISESSICLIFNSNCFHVFFNMREGERRARPRPGGLVFEMYILRSIVKHDYPILTIINFCPVSIIHISQVF